ncbi:MAG: hypothetical protein IPP19_07460 [Verrucomicrobia bacterium]|nr:hypothetical protein [Verrucomicrobiota bacterium]
MNDSLKKMSASEADEWMCQLVKTSNRVLIDLSFEQFGKKAHGTNGSFLERAVLAAVQANDLDLTIKLLDVGGARVKP